eukprot:CAMPEP_0175569844 /NCGR_PEP_ID=MMETSP0096-20121207/41691_1 /TAXON_ID=311494 /ORGANISM="Alexandrium monilatum, Strain CCMP3105" /LENGTH=32 /DNA_ID= /DNA_START= /DNA_END= /DNA_ORIENTATION=
MAAPISTSGVLQPQALADAGTRGGAETGGLKP